MALTKVEADGINLADTFAFSGTVTGAGVSNVTPADPVLLPVDLETSIGTTTVLTFFFLPLPFKSLETLLILLIAVLADCKGSFLFFSSLPPPFFSPLQDL